MQVWQRQSGHPDQKPSPKADAVPLKVRAEAGVFAPARLFMRLDPTMRESGRFRLSPFHQREHMRGHRARQFVEVVAAFQHRDDAAAAASLGARLCGAMGSVSSVTLRLASSTPSSATGFCIASEFISDRASSASPSTPQSERLCSCSYCGSWARADGAAVSRLSRSAAILLTPRQSRGELFRSSYKRGEVRTLRTSRSERADGRPKPDATTYFARARGGISNGDLAVFNERWDRRSRRLLAVSALPLGVHVLCRRSESLTYSRRLARSIMSLSISSRRPLRPRWPGRKRMRRRAALSASMSNTSAGRRRSGESREPRLLRGSALPRRRRRRRSPRERRRQLGRALRPRTRKVRAKKEG